MKKHKENDTFHKQYSIELEGLKLGVHNYEFFVENDFFVHYDNSPITNGDFDIFVQLEKKNNLLVLAIDIDGDIDTACDRCLQFSSIPITQSHQVFVKYSSDGTSSEAGTKKDINGDEIIYIEQGDTHLYLADLFYELIVLAQPTRKIPCEISNDESVCNQVALDKLYGQQEEKDNTQESTDPRWAALEKLKNKN